MPGLAPLDPRTLFSPVEDQPTLGLAVSGGADSLALMLLAHAWAGPRGVALHVYSVDHGLRPEAAGEVAFVLREAERLGLPARGLRWDGPHPATGVQAAARAARYRLLAEAAAEDGCTYVATAHHLRDQAETVLMRMAHGSGIDGLSGMETFAAVEGCEVFRPLLAVDPERLGDIVKGARLTPVADPSNEDTGYERIRWRNALPALEALGLTPERLGGFARRMGEMSLVTWDYLEEVWPQVAEVEPGFCAMPQDRFVRMPPPVRVLALGRMLRHASDSWDKPPPSLSRLEELQGQLARREIRQVTIHGCLLATDGEVISARPEGPRKAALKKRKAETAN